jgi:hypothetical protein
MGHVRREPYDHWLYSKRKLTSVTSFELAEAEVMVTNRACRVTNSVFASVEPTSSSGFCRVNTRLLPGGSQEGEVELVTSSPSLKEIHTAVKVIDITRLYAREKHNTALLSRAIEVEACLKVGVSISGIVLKSLSDSKQ